MMYQDNTLTIPPATNGQTSSSKKTKHIHHRYFLTKDKVVCGDPEVKYAPTEEMWSDMLTNPHQGMLFMGMRAELMIVEVNDDDEVERKNTHPKLLPQDIETMSTKSVELLVRSGVTGASQRRRSGNPTVVPATK